MSDTFQQSAYLENFYKKNLLEAIEMGYKMKFERKEDIDYKTIPNGVKYSEMEKYLKKYDPEITRRKFTSYIEQGLLPEGIKKNEKLTIYLKEHALRYMVIAKYKDYLPLNRLKSYFQSTHPAYKILGWESGFNPFETFDFKDFIKPVIGVFQEQIKEIIEDELEGEFVEYSNEEVSAMKTYLESFILSNLLLQYGKAYLDMFDELLNNFTRNVSVFSTLSEMAENLEIKYEENRKEKIIDLEQQKIQIQESIKQLTKNIESVNDAKRRKELQHLLEVNENLLLSIELLRRSWE
jgi:hypothetical protein